MFVAFDLRALAVVAMSITMVADLSVPVSDLNSIALSPPFFFVTINYMLGLWLV
jgi:hypothetical protein